MALMCLARSDKDRPHQSANQLKPRLGSEDIERDPSRGELSTFQVVDVELEGTQSVGKSCPQEATPTEEKHQEMSSEVGAGSSGCDAFEEPIGDRRQESPSSMVMIQWNDERTNEEREGGESDLRRVQGDYGRLLSTRSELERTTLELIVTKSEQEEENPHQKETTSEE